MRITVPTYGPMGTIEVPVDGDYDPHQTNYVLIHGNSTSSKVWDNVRKVLSPAITIECFGHGLSTDHLDKIPTIDEQITAMGEVLQYLGMKSCVLVGHSLGGHIAIRLMNYLQARVDVKGVVLIGTAPLGAPVPSFSPKPNAIGLISLMSQTTPFSEKERMAFVEHQGLPSSFYAVANRVSWGRGVVKSLLDSAFDEWTTIKTLDVPVLCLHAEDDSVVNIECLKLLAKTTPHVHLEIIPNAPHGMIYTHANTVARCIAMFTAF